MVLITRSPAWRREVVPAAEAMPDDKFNFAPTQGDFKGVRTFAQQVKHIATVNYMLGASYPGREAASRSEGRKWARQHHLQG